MVTWALVGRIGVWLASTVFSAALTYFSYNSGPDLSSTPWPARETGLTSARVYSNMTKKV